MTAQKSTENVRSVNSQITDAITQTSVMNLGLAPAQSLGTLYQTSSHATGQSMQNAVANQQNMYSLGLASLVQNLQSILSQTSAAAARSSASAQQRSAPATNYHPHTSYHPAAAAPAPHPAAATPPKK
ncbi:RebB family R body protein [Sneathiella sp.]|uniref:RebB family R body protein n=1 Tax=Sneathiella sp. TaxID=1964365 RepID=UPI0035686A39